MKKSVKYFVIGACSFILMSSIATAIAVPITSKINNTKSNNSNNFTNNNSNSVLIKKAIKKEVKEINANNSTKSVFVLNQNTAITVKIIKNQIINSIKKSIPNITTSEIKQIENNLKVKLLKTKNNSGLIYNGTIIYDGTNYPIIIQGSEEINTTSNLIYFKQQNYTLNLQTGQT
ncbi:hypothetical protein IKS57_04685 [bacterium]|nr:hypothetical protein [bacterium]